MGEKGQLVGWLVSLVLALWLAAACGGDATGSQPPTGGEPSTGATASGGASESGGGGGGATRATGGAAGADSCVVGDERCDCYPNGTCNGTLRCLSGLCVDYDPATGGSAGSGVRATGGAAGAGSCVVGNERCDCYPDGTCNGTLRCLSGLCDDYDPATGGNGGTGGSDSGGVDSGGVHAGGVAGRGGSPPAGAAGNWGASGGDAGAAGAASGGVLPCEVLESAGLPCIAAHSTVRRLVSDYAGPLYQVCRGTAVAGPDSCQGEARDIGIVNGLADASAQDAFCADGSCAITIVYDQSRMGNDLEPAPPGGAKPTPDNPAKAADLPLTIGGSSGYGMLFRPGVGYRKVFGNGTAVGDEPQTIYMVTSQHDLIDGCCFDYGNAEASANDDGNGCVEAVYFGGGVIWGTGSGGKPGPWVMADLENGLYAGWEDGQDQNISTNTPLGYDFVTAILVGDTADRNDGRGRFALYGGDATAGGLRTMYDGIRPEKPGYVPMQKQGSIVLGIAGDNSSGAGGRFYEGVMANGAASKETIDALQASIVAAGYGR